MQNQNINEAVRMQEYLLGLLQKNIRKTCTGMAEEIGISHDKLQKILTATSEKKTSVICEESIAVIRSLGAHNGAFGTDDTLVVKPFGKKMPELGYHKESSTGQTVLGFSIVVVVWIYKDMIIPVGFDVWIKGTSIKKHDIAAQLIEQIKEQIRVDLCLFDGLYAIPRFMAVLLNAGVNFVMRIAANRVVTFPNGTKNNLRDHFIPLMKRNMRYLTQRCSWYGMPIYVTCIKLKAADGEFKYIFLVSSFFAAAKESLTIYSKRWAIEKFFRTAKQKLGLQHCQAHSMEKQKAHIFMVMMAYILAQLVARCRKLKNPEEALKYLLTLKRSDIKKQIVSLGAIFHAYA